MFNFFNGTKKTKKQALAASNSVYLGAKAGMVALFYKGTMIPLAPDLADKIAAHMPRYAQIARNLEAKPPQPEV